MEKKAMKSAVTKSRGSTRQSHAQDSRTGSPMSRTRSSRKENVKEGSKARNEKKGHLLEEFFLDELKDIFWAEKHLVKALTKLAKNATSDELRKAFEEHRKQTEIHAQRIEEVFEILGEQAKAKKCKAIAGITKEGEELIRDTKDDTFTRDVALIMAGQKAEHYEIATYGGLATIARTLGKPQEAIDLLELTLEEEKNADQLLTSIAESFVNEEATAE